MNSPTGEFPEKVYVEKRQGKAVIRALHCSPPPEIAGHLEIQPYFSASVVQELAGAGTDAWSEIEEALNCFGEGTLDEIDLLVRLRVAQSKLLPCTEAQSSLKGDTK